MKCEKCHKGEEECYVDGHFFCLDCVNLIVDERGHLKKNWKYEV